MNSNDPIPSRTSAERTEEILKAMQAANGGRLERTAAGQLTLVHPLTGPDA